MAELVLKHLTPCYHVPLAHKRKINEVEPYLSASDYFLNLTPEVMKSLNSITFENTGSPPPSSSSSSGTIKTIGHTNFGINNSDSLYSNYYAYIFDAHHKIAQCKKACDDWPNKYRYQKLTSSRKNSGSVSETNNLTNINNNNNGNAKKGVNSQKVQMIKQILEELDCGEICKVTVCVSPSSGSDNGEKNKLHDSLQSIGESSGYESFRYRPEDDPESESSENNNKIPIEESQKSIIVQEPWKVSSRKLSDDVELDLAEDLFAKGTINLGEYKILGQSK